MHSYLTIALLSLAPSTTWESSYSQAQQQAAAQKKPLAIVFGSGHNSWTNALRRDSAAAQVDRLLAENYVCVYVDTNSDSGKRLAQSFELTESVGLVIGDRDGRSQAFWHQGDMAAENMVGYLTKYADPQVVVRQTETAQVARPTGTATYAPMTYSGRRGRSGYSTGATFTPASYSGGSTTVSC